MDRRRFLTGRIHARPPRADVSVARPAAGLEPYSPSAQQPWDAIRAGHLLRRATFAPRWTDIGAILAMSPSAAVDMLLEAPYSPPEFGRKDSVTESLEGLDVVYASIIQQQWQNDYEALQDWQAQVMLDSPLGALEKTVGFFSNHFATEFAVDQEYVIAPLLYRQNVMFRQGAYGSYREMMLNITLDPAMLVYLGTHLSKRGNPNENYAREMLELYTTGLGEYTEGDIKEAARILTGWKVAQYSDKEAPNGFFNTWFEPDDHDIAGKQFFGVSFAARNPDQNTEFLVRRDEIKLMTDTIFERRADAVAKFICRKLYRFFVYSNPGATDENVIDQMAAIFKQNDFRIKPVLSALFKSAHFFDNANIGAQIKTPAEYVIGIQHQIGGVENIADSMGAMEMELFDPPNVSGWPGWRDWITTTTFPVRGEVAETAVASLDDGALLDFVRQFPEYDDVHVLVTNVAALLLPRPLSNGRRTSLEQDLLSGAPDYEWANIVNDPGTAAVRIRAMLERIISLPDFQLC